MKTIWGAFATLTVVIMFLSFSSTLADEAGEKNNILDDESKLLIIELNYQTEQFNPDALSEQQSNVTDDSSFEGVDAFARQFLEDKSEIAQKKTTIDKVLGVPDLILRAIGIENNTLITLIKVLIVSAMSFAIGLAVYKAVRTGDVG